MGAAVVMITRAFCPLVALGTPCPGTLGLRTVPLDSYSLDPRALMISALEVAHPRLRLAIVPQDDGPRTRILARRRTDRQYGILIPSRGSSTWTANASAGTLAFACMYATSLGLLVFVRRRTPPNRRSGLCRYQHSTDESISCVRIHNTCMVVGTYICACCLQYGYDEWRVS